MAEKKNLEKNPENKPSIKEILMRTVDPIIGYSVFFGSLAVAIGLGLIICL